jgi:hypothetical protein
MVESQAEIVVVNDYEWIGNPRLGAFSVRIDGRRVGVSPLSGRGTFPVSAGTHSIRARFAYYYFMSPTSFVEVPPGGRVVLHVNKPQGPAAKAMLRLLVHPFTSLSLLPEPPHLGAPTAPFPVPAGPGELARRRRGMLAYGIAGASVLGAILLMLAIVFNH